MPTDSQKAQETYTEDVIAWTKRGKVGEKLKFQIKGYLDGARHLWTLSTFPAISTVLELEDMDITGTEIFLNNWY